MVLGGVCRFGVSTNTTLYQYSNEITSKWTNATHASRTSQFEVWGVNNAITARKLAIAGSGLVTLDAYGTGARTGTATYSLNVDASGNIIEGAIGGGGGTSSNLTLGTATSSTLPITNSNGTGVTLPIFGTTAGLVPGTTSNTTNFLRADGTFAIPPGSGGGGISQQTLNDTAAILRGKIDSLNLNLVIDNFTIKGNNTVDSPLYVVGGNLTGIPQSGVTGLIDSLTSLRNKPVSTLQQVLDAGNTATGKSINIFQNAPQVGFYLRRTSDSKVVYY